MNLFLYEYLFFISSIVAILVSVSASSLFFLAAMYEKKLLSARRAVGFAVVGVAFLVGILERKSGAVGFGKILLEVIGFTIIALGVIQEPDLSHLNILGETKKTEAEVMASRRNILLLLVGTLFIVFLTLLSSFFSTNILTETTLELYLEALLQGIATLFILITIVFQVRRYIQGSSDRKIRLQNLYPLLGYVFLFIRGIALILYRVPELDVDIFHSFVLNSDAVWQISYLTALFGFIFLGIWAWNFIKIRFFLRVYVVFLVIGIVMASLGSLLVLFLNFRIVEINTLQQLDDHVETINVIMQDRLSTADFISRFFSSHNDLILVAKENDKELLEKRTTEFLEDAELDIIRIYDTTGTIIASPDNPNEIGRTFEADPQLQIVFEEEVQVVSFDTTYDVLSPIIIARSLYPLRSGGKLTGVIEVGYKFDSAFVDFLGRETTFDVSIYTGAVRSATTITYGENNSRWIGSLEANTDALEKVLGKGENFQGLTSGLEFLYYSGFSPIRDSEDLVIGMVAVSSSTYELFEDTRQQLVTSFLLVASVSLLPTLLGYIAIRSFNFEKIPVDGKNTMQKIDRRKNPFNAYNKG